MRYPKPLKKGDTIGVCAPSSGVAPYLHKVLDNAIANVTKLGYQVIVTDSVRHDEKMVSADAKTRAKEFMELYTNQSVKAIIPPYGGEFLMDMLPYLDFELLSRLEPKWVCGYSDITTLLVPLTLLCDIATIHGANFMNMGFKSIDPSELFLYEILSKEKTVQNNFEFFGEFNNFGNEKEEIYRLDKKSTIIPIGDFEQANFSGRIIGGCMDVLCPLIGTKYMRVQEFLDHYKEDGFIWTLESCEMNATEIYRAFWQMRQNNWFENCNGILIGRPAGYSPQQDFTISDAFRMAFEGMDVPILFGCDIGHIPPQIQLINGSIAEVSYQEGTMRITQEQR
jgi:muramoyltetrapeptide carboxypeptidase LdcA involved in peptidoglycan recycling